MDEELNELQLRICQLNENVEDLQSKNDRFRLQIRLYQNKLNVIQKERPTNTIMIIKDYEQKFDELKNCLRYCNEQQDRMIKKFRQAEDGLTQTQMQKDLKYIEELNEESIKIDKLNTRIEYQKDLHLRYTHDLREENSKMRKSIEELLAVSSKFYTSYFPTIETLIAFFKRFNSVKLDTSSSSTKSEPSLKDKKIEKRLILKIKKLKLLNEKLVDDLREKQNDIENQRAYFQQEIQRINNKQADSFNNFRNKALDKALIEINNLKKKIKEQKEQSINKDKKIQNLEQHIEKINHAEEENEQISQKSILSSFEKQRHMQIIRNQENEIFELKAKLNLKMQKTLPDPIWSEFYFNELPSELIPSFLELVHNTTISAPVKLNMGLKALKSYYDNLLNEEKRHNKDLVDRIEIADIFLKEIGHLVIDRQITSLDLLEEIELKPNIIHKIEEDHFRMLDDFNQSTSKISELQRQIAELKHRIEITKPSIRPKNEKKNPKFISIQTSTNLESEFENKSINTEQDVQIDWSLKTKILESQLNNERQSFIEQLKNVRQQTICEYENLVDQLKKRCNEQHITIETLTSQIQTYPYK